MWPGYAVLPHAWIPTFCSTCSVHLHKYQGITLAKKETLQVATIYVEV